MSLNVSPISLTITATFEDYCELGRQQFFRRKSVSGMVVALVANVALGTLLALRGAQSGGIVFFVLAAIVSFVLAITALQAFYTWPSKAWKATSFSGADRSTDYTFSMESLASVSPAFTADVKWTMFERYLVTPTGLILVYKTKQPIYFSRAELGDAYAAFRQILAANLPCTAYLDDRLPASPPTRFTQTSLSG